MLWPNSRTCRMISARLHAVVRAFLWMSTRASFAAVMVDSQPPASQWGPGGTTSWDFTASPSQAVAPRTQRFRRPGAPKTAIIPAPESRDGDGECDGQTDRRAGQLRRGDTVGRHSRAGSRA